ncbi:MAG: hypothetical protein ACP5RR_08775 [Candidatus Kapaibacteriota bacterium]
MKTLKTLNSIAAILFLVLVSVAAAQDKKDSTKTDHKMMKYEHSKMHETMKDSTLHSKMMDKKETMMKKDSSNSMKMEMKGMDRSHNKMMDKDKKKSPLIREGKIDLNEI